MGEGDGREAGAVALDPSPCWLAYGYGAGVEGN